MPSSKKRHDKLASSILSDLPPIAPSLGFLHPSSQQSATANPSDQQHQLSPQPKKKIPQTIKLASRLIFTSRRPQSWSWKPFKSSARVDDAQFCHWVRSNAEYPDYPYARFDVSLDKLIVSEEEWGLLDVKWNEVDSRAVENKLGKDKLIKETAPKIPPWTRQETETLLELVHEYDLRWPVIIDRWHARFNILEDGKVNSLSVQRTVEDLQYWYYHVGNVLARKRLKGAVDEMATQNNAAALAVGVEGVDATIAKAEDKQPTKQHNAIDQAALTTLSQNLAKHPSLVPNVSLPGTGTTINSKPFDLIAEKARRSHLQNVWNRPKSEEEEEVQLRGELRAIELQLRKLKKSGKIMVPKGSTHSVSSAKSALRVTKPKSERKAELDAYVATTSNLTTSFAATAPVPTPGTPYLQSGRLFAPALGGGLNKSTLKQMEEILAELKVKEPIATKRACDLYDEVRKDALTLLILQKIVLRKEAEVMTKREKLVDVLGVGNGPGILEEKTESKKRKKSDLAKQPVASSVATVTHSEFGAPPAKKKASVGKTLHAGKKLPMAGEQSKKKPSKKMLPLTGASASLPTQVLASVVNPLDVGETLTSAVPDGVSGQSASIKTASISAPAPAKKKRGRPAKSKSPPRI